MERLLEIVEEVFSLDEKEWRIVVMKYNGDENMRDRVSREVENLKQKFERLVAVKKQIGHPS